ncbi:TPA: hypothetical protein DIC39_03475 [Patescibacteria group bacterium]|nr:hypothetical protein [Patescibacteria group bacterium]
MASNQENIEVLVLLAVSIIILIPLVIMPAIKKRRQARERALALQAVIALGGVNTFPIGRYQGGLPTNDEVGKDMLVSVTGDAFVFYPYQRSAIEVSRIPLSAINEISISDKTSTYITPVGIMSYGLFGSTYTKYDLVIAYKLANSQLQEKAIFRFMGGKAKQQSSQAVDELKKYIH